MCQYTLHGIYMDSLDPSKTKVCKISTRVNSDEPNKYVLKLTLTTGFLD